MGARFAPQPSSTVGGIPSLALKKAIDETLIDTNGVRWYISVDSHRATSVDGGLIRVRRHIAFAGEI